MSEDMQLKWKVYQMECYPSFNGQKDYVFNVHWGCLAYYNGPSGGPFWGRTYSCTSVPANSGDFIAYNDLQESEVLSWVYDVIGENAKTTYESGAMQQITDQLVPPVVKLQNPWPPDVFPVIAPRIVEQPPSSITVFSGNSAEIQVSCGGQPINYQWQLNSIDIANATGASFYLQSAQPSDIGSYTLTVSNDLGSATSSGCYLDVILNTGIIQ